MISLLSWLPIWPWSAMLDPCFIHCHIPHEKFPFYCAETAPNRALNRRCVVDFDRLWGNALPISNRAFSCSNVHAKWWMHCLLISPRCQLSHATSIYYQPKPFCGFFYIFWNNCRIRATRAFSIIGVCTTAFKISKPFVSMEQSPDNTCQAIALVERYFSPLESSASSTCNIQIFPLFWKLQK